MTERGRLLAVAVGLCAAGAACVSAFAFAGSSLWLDEAYSVLLARAGPAGILRYLRTDLGPPLYYLLLDGWIALFGDGERAVRALSGGAYLLTGGVLAWGARSLWGHPMAAAGAAALFWSSALAVRHALSARMYALLGLWVALSLVLWLRRLRTPETARWRWLAAAVNTLGLLTQYWFAFVLLAQWAVERLLLGGRRSLRASLIAQVLPVGLFALLWGPVLLQQWRAGGAAWIDPVGPLALLTTFLDFYGSWIAVLAFTTFAVLLCVRLGPRPGLVDRAALRERLLGPEGAALALVCLASVAIPFLLSFAKPIYLVGRYTLVALPPFALWLGAALARAAPRATGGVLLVLIAVRLLATSGDQLRWARRDAAQSSRASAVTLAERLGPGTTVVYTGLGGVTLGYYLGRQGRFEQRTFPPAASAHPGWLDSEAEASRPGTAEEATAVVSALPQGELWHVFEEGDPLAAILSRALQAQRGAPTERLALPGSFHDTAERYRAQ